MKLIYVTTALVVAFLSAFFFHLGLLDRPALERRTTVDGLYGIIATTRTNKIGENIRRLLDETHEGIISLHNGETLLSKGCFNYLESDTLDELALGLWLDSPTEEEPRWGAGWLVGVHSLLEAETLSHQVQSHATSWKEGEVVRATRIAPMDAMVTSVPWRRLLAPWLASHIHWHRMFVEYNQTYGDEDDRQDLPEPIAMEVYIPEDGAPRTDYVLLVGDTHAIRQNLFPTHKIVDDIMDTLAME